MSYALMTASRLNGKTFWWSDCAIVCPVPPVMSPKGHFGGCMLGRALAEALSRTLRPARWGTPRFAGSLTANGRHQAKTISPFFWTIIVLTIYRVWTKSIAMKFRLAETRWIAPIVVPAILQSSAEQQLELPSPPSGPERARPPAERPHPTACR